MRPAITFQNSDVARQWKRLHMPVLEYWVGFRFRISSAWNMNIWM